VSIKYTKTNLKKIEQIFTAHDFTIRYERGQFNSGYCILRDKQVIVINRFFKEKGRIESLLDIMQQVELNEDLLSEEGKKILKNVEKGYIEQMEMEMAH